MNFLWFLIHTFTGCLKADIIHKRGCDICSKCGRMTFHWNK